MSRAEIILRRSTMSATTRFESHAVIDLTTVGRVTGRPHTIEIWFARRGATIYMLSGGGDRSDWVRNLVHTPRVTVEVGGAAFPGTARIVTDPDEERVARDAVHGRYAARSDSELTGWRDTALPIAVDLDDVG